MKRSWNRFAAFCQFAGVFLAPDTGGGSGGDGTVNAADLLPGSEMLAGGTIAGSAEDFDKAAKEGLPDLWTLDNATGDEDEEEEGSKVQSPKSKVRFGQGRCSPTGSAQLKIGNWKLGIGNSGRVARG